MLQMTTAAMPTPIKAAAVAFFNAISSA